MNDDARIRDAARRGMAEDVIAGLPQGYEQLIGRRFKQGVDLSGGQWQKIAIARAYMRDAQVMIPTNPPPRWMRAPNSRCSSASRNCPTTAPPC